MKTGSFKSKSSWVRLKQALTRRRHPFVVVRYPASLETRSFRDSSSSSGSSRSSDVIMPTIITFDTPPVDGSHNEKLPINRLPPEILAEVFILVCEASELSDYSWLACSHVSSSWRQISLDIPQLWGHVIFRSSEWTRLCIERSKSSLLVIQANITCPRVDDLVCEALELADKVGRVTLRFVELRPRVLQLLAGPFPRLTSLSIESNSFWVAPTIPLDPTVYPYPRLRDLSIRSNVVFLPPLPVQLVSLSISYADTETLGWDVFSDALQHLLELEVLTLRGFPVPSASSSPRQIRLPSLLDLYLSASPADCTQLIQTLECPHLRRYDLDLWNVADVASMFQTVLANLVESPKSMFIHRIQSTQVVFGFAYDDARDRRAVLAGDICFGWRLPLSDSDLAQLFAAISDIALIDGVRWLCLGDWTTTPQGSWSAFLRRLVRLQSLLICGRPASGLLWDLVKCLEGDVADVVLSELTEIELDRVDCAAGGWLTRRPRINAYFDLDGARFLEVLVCYLELRTIQLAKLKVNQCCNFTGAEIKLLRRLVADVQWDGVGLMHPSYYPNGDEFGALTINHNLLSSRPGYEELNLSDEERYRRHNWVHSGTRPK
ncbi:hypothetical protein DFH09DRAFT_1197977 [Mycena vulgaris]|nr:hypothetical protein DFH09DRAFT_1197977 [Mycena vulgaris]